jgi:signal transduction histidine kinase/ActR/RegA family two-component response regulator
MTAFRDLPIRRKLLLMTLFPTAAALVMSSAGFLLWDVNQLRSEITEDLGAQARIVSEAAAPAMTFRDPGVAGETLNVLAIRPRVRVGCLYGTNGVLFARFQRSPDEECPGQPPAATHAGWQQYDVVYPVMTKNDRVGTLYVSRDLADVVNRLRVGAVTVLGLLLLAIGTASLIARGMQRAIATPLLELANTARTITTTPDTSVRAVASSKDETGTVVVAVNEMLDRIAERTTALSKANAELEREVEERRRAEGERTAALERERDANRLKDEFLATLSHELRTPLNAVLGWTRVLRSAQVEPSTHHRALESIERNARAQARLIEDLLEISRIVTGKLRLQTRETDLAAIVDAAVEIVQPAAAAKRLRLNVEIAARPALTIGDPDRLQQVVWNLLSNAVKFTAPDGEVTVRLVRDGGYRLSVTDTGQGIDPRFLPHVFEAFRQADGTASREHGGLGLGLAIARQIVEMHGGTIQARSEGRDTGATFEVQLPSVVQPAVPASGRETMAVALPADPIDSSLLRDVRILVVDDEEDARVLMETALTQYGAVVSTAASVAEAFEIMDRAAPDAIVSDIGMPNEDGYSLIRRLRARPASRGGDVPAIAVTAYASRGDQSATEAAGYQAHVAKPFEPAEVARLVARLIGTPTRQS